MEDIFYRFLDSYHSLPLPVKQLAGRLYNLLPLPVRYGRFYREYSERLNRFAAIDNYQDVIREQEILLFRQVNRSLKSTPGYSNYIEINNINDFRKLPVIDKKTIVSDTELFVARSMASKGIRTNTGGSSGTPMEFYIEKHVSRPKEKVHFMWFWGQFGYKPGDRMIMVRGMPLAQNRMYEYMPIDNMLGISCYNINDSNIKEIALRIRRFRPLFIYGYPSSLKNLVLLLKSNGYNPDYKINAVFCGSEYLSEPDRELFSTYFNARVINWYGHSERLIHGGNCPHTNLYHFHPAYGYMELIDENGDVISQPGIEGRIVATGFDNRVMPFIRYDTGDRGVLSGMHTCSCGFKGLSLEFIRGRGQDFIYLIDGTRVSLTAFIFGQHLKAFAKIREMQVVQRTQGNITLNLVKNNDFTPEDEESTRQALLKSVNNKLEIEIIYSESIPKTYLGKNIFFISEIKN